MRRTMTVVVLGAILSGCVTSTVDTNYGSAAKNLLEVQSAYPRALHDPSTSVVESANPDVIENAFISMRKDTASRAGIDHNILINGNAGAATGAPATADSPGGSPQ